MTVLVTGGAGFVFSHVVDQLLVTKHKVRILDNMSTGTYDNLIKWIDPATKTTHPNLHIVRADLRDKHKVRECVQGCDWILHGGALARIQPSLDNPQETFDVNVGGTINILEAAREFCVKRVVFAASSSVYGLLNPTPNVETMPTHCMSPYSLSKKIGEDLMDLYNKTYGISTCSLRFFNVMGCRHISESSYATVVAIFRRQKRLGQKLTVVGDGSQRRDMTQVSDVVHAVMKAAMNYSATGIYNIGSGVNYSILDVAKLIAEGDESMIEYIPSRKAEAKETLADISKAKKVLGWTPKLSLEQGLKVIDAYELKYPPKSSNLIIMP